jgi:hypothetical protein
VTPVLLFHTLIILACGIVLGHVLTVLWHCRREYYNEAYHDGWEAHKVTVEAIGHQREITRHGRRLRRDYS